MGSSLLYPGEQLFNDDTPEEAHAVLEGFGRGYDPSSRTAEGYGSTADPFPSDLLIPRSEWQARIEEMEKTKSRLSDLIVQSGLPPKNQQQTSYCWINAVTHTLEIQRVLQNEPMVILSPASAGARIKNFRNVGGWGREAIEWVSDHGVVPVDHWPPNAIDRKYDTDENHKLAMNYRFVHWTFTDNSLDQIMSLLLRRIAIAVGLSWWSHEITYVDPLWLDGAAAVRGRNSWGDIPGQYPNGFFTLQGRKMTPDDSVAPLEAIAC